ncbi:MAG TPA: TonB-dependent siderophore receptor [Ramlibacter sp.]|uniref:TonB-dependent receptor n=1 Tax=Ramlibacter sp. TaxID=1917967 RepID=UPI002BD9AB47|nr:TonB-dependent siderophore receptor [Ramlibacter sp.]HVZ42817.1 TonB-dependent siderophore receptor [Ramlibacter sp.]
MLAASLGSWAQSAAPTAPTAPQDKALTTITVREKAEAPRGKDDLRATTTHIGKGTQELRDVPQSMGVVTEKLIDDRNLDTVKDALRQTAGVTFQAAEGGEEDIRLRGFSLATTGDIFLDGMRDPAFYDRDTFNLDRLEVLRGSASMLFGRGSTGGAVNQVSKMPELLDENEVVTTLGSHSYRRVTGDFNKRTGEHSAVRVTAMYNEADNNGAGSSIDKRGLAGAYRFGIDTPDEVLVSLYWLDNNNGINYGLPWIKPHASDTTAANTIIGGLKPTDYFGMASDYNAGTAKIATLAHTHRFSENTQLKTMLRKGEFTRDLRAGTVRFAAASAQPGGLAADLSNFGPGTVFTRGTNLKIQDMDVLQAQSDLSSKFEAFDLHHELTTGIDFSREQKKVYAALSAAQGGPNIVKPPTLAGTPDDGAWVDESSRILRDNNDFVNDALGAYVQDMVQVAPHWKVLGGLRYDHMRGRYNAYGIPSNAPGPVTTTSYRQGVADWSKRVGLLYQPTDRMTFHFSYGTSFNTSGDTYSYNALSANTPPEQSENIEAGGTLETADKRFFTRFAVFRSTKKNERNTDPDSAATRLLLSGKRHAAGIEIDASGRITPRWEVYGSYQWLPIARVDDAAATVNTVGNREGDRPGLSPRHSGTVWSTYQIAPKWRVGAGINFRSRQAPADVTAPAWEAPGFVTADLMTEYAITPDIMLKANVTNLTDKLYAESLYRGHYIPGAGRLVQVSLGVKF